MKLRFASSIRPHGWRPCTVVFFKSVTLQKCHSAHAIRTYWTNGKKIFPLHFVLLLSHFGLVISCISVEFPVLIPVQRLDIAIYSWVDCMYASALPFLSSTLIACLRLSWNHPVFPILNEKAYLFWSCLTLGTLVPRQIQSSLVCCPSPIPSLGFPLHQVYDKSRCPPAGMMETGEAPWGLQCHHCKK